MFRHIFVIGCLLTLVACSQPERGLLPLYNAPLRQQAQDVPPDGIIQVNAGDTIYTIANRYQVTPRRIILTNAIAPPYDLSGIQTLSVPKPRGHAVAEDDTLDAISSRYKVSKTDLISLNNLIPPYQLNVGMRISIPRKIDYSLLDGIDANSANTADAGATSSSSGNTAVIPKSSLTSKAVSYSNAGISFAWPVNGNIILPYGISAHGVHNDGVNIAAAIGTEVRASQAGEVAFVGAGLKAFGNLVLIKHRDGWITAYAHMNNVRVSEGEQLDRGQVIGGVGQTGRVDSPQLHFEIRKQRTPINPEEFLS